MPVENKTCRTLLQNGLTAIGLAFPLLFSVGAHAVEIASFTIGNAGSVSILPDAAASASTLRWTVTSATSCESSGDWPVQSRSVTSGNASVPTAVRTTPGDYSFTLTCTDDEGSDSKTVTLNVQAPDPVVTIDIPIAPSIRQYLIEDGVLVIPQGGNLSNSPRALVRYTSSCTYHIGSESVAGFPNYVYSTPGRQDATVTCESVYGKDPATATQPIDVWPAPIISSFTSSNPAPQAGEQVTLSWATQNAGSCTLNGATTSAVNGSQTVTVAFDEQGNANYELSCGWTKVFPDVLIVFGGIKVDVPVVKTISFSGDPGQGEPQPVPSISSFTASPASITSIQTSTLSWSVQDADTCTASGAWSGSKAPANDSETLAGLAAGTYNYTLICQNDAGSSEPQTVTLTVEQASPVQITGFTISSPSILQEEAASLSWTVANAQSCTGGGDWSGAKNVNGGSQSLSTTIRNNPGDYSFTLDCTGDGSSDSRTVTLHVEARDPEITLFDINVLPSIRQYLRDDNGRIIVPQGGGSFGSGLQFGSRYTTSCAYRIGDDEISFAELRNYIFNTPGQQDAVVTCEGHPGKGSVSRTLPFQVIPAPQITSFTASTQQASAGADITLSWATENTAFCRLNGVPVDDVNGSQTVSVDFGQQGFAEYGLACDWTVSFPEISPFFGGIQVDVPVTQTLSINQDVGGLSGRYFGAFDLIMASAPRAGESGLPLSSGNLSNDEGDTFVALGHSQPGTFWMWDFDALNETGTGIIHLGGSNLLAVMTASPPFRLFSPERQRIEGQRFPDVQPPLADHIGTFTDRGDGTYDVWFNYQIFLEFATYPMVKLTNRLRVSLDEQGVMTIVTLDYTENGPPLDAPDGVPGMRSPMPGEINIYGDTTAASGENFPARVSPSIYATHMLKVDVSDLGANGLPRVVNDALGLDNALVDNDGDGIPDAEEIGDNWALPISSASAASDELGVAYQDYVFDVFKPTQFIDPPNFIGQIPLGSGERVVLYRQIPVCWRTSPAISVPVIRRRTPVPWAESGAIATTPGTLSSFRRLILSAVSL